MTNVPDRSFPSSKLSSTFLHIVDKLKFVNFGFKSLSTIKLSYFMDPPVFKNDRTVKDIAHFACERDIFCLSN